MNDEAKCKASLLELIQHDPNLLRHMSYQPYDVCVYAVKRRGSSIQFVNIDNITSELCFLAVSEDVESLRFINESFHNEELYLKAVSIDGWVLRFVKKQTPEICLTALKNDWCHSVYRMIDIPIEGEFLKEINRMKLLKGPL